MKGTRKHSATKRLWPNRDATTRFLIGLGGKECSCCVHGVDVEEVGLPWPLLAEGQFVVCLISALFSVGKKFKRR